LAISNPDFLKFFGEIKFAEENSMCLNDFERAIKRYLFGKEKKHRGSFKFGEIDNDYLKDFSRSFKSYFE
jgi:hypothetical protein